MVFVFLLPYTGFFIKILVYLYTIFNMFRQSLLVLKQILSYVKVKNFQVVSLKYKSDGDRRYYCDYCQHNYDKSIKGLVDAQINQELTAGYTYLNIANYFAQSNVALPGVHGFFMKMFYEELGHGFDFIKYQIKRGASVNLCPLNCSKPNKWNIATVFACALDMEKNIKEVIKIIRKKLTSYFIK